MILIAQLRLWLEKHLVVYYLSRFQCSQRKQHKWMLGKIILILLKINKKFDTSSVVAIKKILFNIWRCLANCCSSRCFFNLFHLYNTFKYQLFNLFYALAILRIDRKTGKLNPISSLAALARGCWLASYFAGVSCTISCCSSQPREGVCLNFLVPREINRGVLIKENWKA